MKPTRSPSTTDNAKIVITSVDSKEVIAPQDTFHSCGEEKTTVALTALTIAACILAVVASAVAVILFIRFRNLQKKLNRERQKRSLVSLQSIEIN